MRHIILQQLLIKKKKTLMNRIDTLHNHKYLETKRKESKETKKKRTVVQYKTETTITSINQTFNPTIVRADKLEGKEEKE